MKIVVFDLDETLGYFTQFGIFWESLHHFLYENHYLKKLSHNDFNETLDLFPEFIRPNIIPILNYLKHKKVTNCCHKLMIYTNNTGPKEWSEFIKNYFETKIQYHLIDQIISAFKINGKHVELCRSTYEKTHKDFIKCTRLPENAEICFIDDTFYPKMSNDNIYYINLKPYLYFLPFERMIIHFEKSAIGKKIIHSVLKEKETKSLNFYDFMMKETRKYNFEYIPKSTEEYEIDKILGKHILTHLQIFFNDRNNEPTKKNIKINYKKHRRNKTSKIH